MPSPCTEGMVTMRMSTVWPSTFRPTRPSWGTRFSEMSRSAMIFTRETTPATIRRGIVVVSLQHAVDAEAHAHLAAVGLEVDVRGALLDRLGDDRVHELDHRRVLGGLADVGDRAPSSSSSSSTASATASSRRLMRPISAGDVVGRGHDRAHLVAGHQLQVVERQHVRRVGHRHQQRAVVVEADRHGVEAARGLGRDQVHRRQVGAVDLQVDVVEAEALGDRAGQLVAR